jgi:hypothetical protein
MAISRVKDHPSAIGVKSPQNLAAGGVLIGLALLVFWQTQDLTTGTAMRMGPGYFPKLLAILIALCGVVLAGMSLTVRGERLQGWALRPIVFILFSIVFFAFAIRPLGIVATGAALVLISSIASREVRWKETLLFAAGLLLFAVLLFPIALSLPLPIWPRF